MANALASKLKTDTPYLFWQGELSGVFCEYKL